MAATLWPVSANTAFAQTTDGWSTGFENTVSGSNPVAYTSGSLLFQDNWDLGGVDRTPRVGTSAEIAGYLTAAGLNVGQTTHSGDQALMVIKPSSATETTGYFVRDIFNTPNTLDTATKVTVDFWARPLTGGLGADANDTPPGNNVDVGEREGNMFIGIADTNDGSSGQRAAAVRFGVDAAAGTQPVYGNIVERHIDYANNPTTVWTKSGLLWQPDHWYNIRMIVDYTSHTYDMYVDGTKANSSPITFYHTAANVAKRFFVSRGTNQAGLLLDDISVLPYAANPGDFNHDGRVDGADFLVWQQDNTVGSLAVWQSNYGYSGGVSAVPEPAALSIAALTLLGLVARRRGQP
jgi:hypothetical protein